MSRIKLLLASAFWLAAGQALSDDDLASTSIDAGRLGLMMEQTQSALASLKLSRSEKPDTPEARRAAAFSELVSAVLDYNRILDEVCGPATVDEKLCTGHYLPRWLSREPASLTDRQLRHMTDEASEKLETLWHVVCARAKAADPNTQVCVIE